MNEHHDELRREAKRISRATTISHMQALDVLAVQRGYSHWGALAKTVQSEPPVKEDPGRRGRFNAKETLERTLGHPTTLDRNCRHIIVIGGTTVGKTTFMNLVMGSLTCATVAIVDHANEIHDAPGARCVRTSCTEDRMAGDRMLADALNSNVDVVVVSELDALNTTLALRAMADPEGPAIITSIHAYDIDDAHDVVRRKQEPHHSLAIPSGVALVPITRDANGKRRIDTVVVTQGEHAHARRGRAAG